MQIHAASDDPSPRGAPSPAPSLPPPNCPSGRSPLGFRVFRIWHQTPVSFV